MTNTSEIKYPELLPPKGETSVTGETYFEIIEGENIPADSEASFYKLVNENDENLEQVEYANMDCAGEWTNCVAWYPGGRLNVVHATNSEDGFRRAKLCRNDVTSATYYSSAVLICAPYIKCTA